MAAGLRKGVVPLALMIGSLAWGAVPPAVVAKYLRIVAVSAGGDAGICCLDPEVGSALSSMGVALDPNAALVYATSAPDVAKHANQNKLVICDRIELIKSGAVIAIVSEGDRPAVYFSPANAAARKLKIPDAMMKMGKAVK